MKTKVYLIKKEPEETNQEIVLRTLNLIPLKDLVTNAEDKILVNPNWVTNDHSDSGNVTSTETIEGFLIYLIEEAKIPPNKIIVADGGDSSSTHMTMKKNNVFRLEEYGVKVIDLNKDDRVNNITIPDPLVLKEVNLAKTAWDASCIISVPSLKTHSMAETTLSMKNIMGTILPKGIMHSNIHEKIADLTSLLIHKMKFNLIDGIIGSEGSEIGGSPVKMDVIVAGEDPVAVDCVGSAIIGYGPKKAKYLKYAEEKELGTANMDDIELIGASIEEVYRKF